MFLVKIRRRALCVCVCDGGGGRGAGADPQFIEREFFTKWGLFASFLILEN